ncbi:MAG: FAD-dependent oxidoreductase, partial [Eubacteriaceae bacterium]|nr:FAD-dependent oxidoreductase [Eubacteriaceae bacterium]
MGRKILIIGGVAGGASAAARLRRNSEDDEIIMFERGPHVSFSNCALPYHLSGIIQDADDLVLMNPEIFLKRFNITARVNNEVISIDRKNKNVIVKNVITGDTYTENYDKLILSPGARPIKENIDGIDSANVFFVRNVVDIDRLNKFIRQNHAKDVLVVGGGFIGIETAENLRKAGYNVSIVIASKQVLNTFDYDMVQILHKEIYDKGINLYIGEKITRIENDIAVLSSGRKIDAKIIIMAKGVIPEITLA